MANLPVDRITPELPPFTNTASDYFSSFLISRGRSRSKEKRYGVTFTCLVSRAVRIKVAQSLDANSFNNALKHFICRRGTVKLITSDKGD